MRRFNYLLDTWTRSANDFQFIGQWQFLFVRDAQRDIVSFRPYTRNAFSHTVCSWLENRATGLENLGWETFDVKEMSAPALVRRFLFTAMSFSSGMRMRNALCDKEFRFCVPAQYVIDFLYLPWLELKWYDTMTFTLPSNWELVYVLRNELVIFSLSFAPVSDSSSFNLELINGIIECNPSFFPIYEVVISEWNAGLCRERKMSLS